MRENRTAIVDSLEPRQLFASLTPGVTVATAIRTVGGQKNYTLPLVAGQSVAVAAGDNASGFTTELILIAPNGKAIARSVGDSGAFIGKVAPVSGNYRVRVRDVSRTNSAALTVTAFAHAPSITDSDDAGTAASGRRFAATIGQGDLDVWTLTAQKNQFLSVVINENTNGTSVGVGVLLVGPDGKGVTSKESETGFSIDVPKAQAGTYYAVVYEPGANASGRYGISFGRTPGAQTTEDPDTQTPLQSGVTRQGDLPSGDIDLFQQTIASGKHVTITATRRTGSTSPQLLLIDPNGNQVATSSGSTSTTLSFTTAIAGVYSILFRNGVADAGGGYNLTYVLS